MLAKIVFGVLAATGLTLVGVSASRPAASDCCYPGAACCVPGAACCDDAPTAKATCCAEPAAVKPDCCYPGSPCCTGGACCLEAGAK